MKIYHLVIIVTLLLIAFSFVKGEDSNYPDYSSKNYNYYTGSYKSQDRNEDERPRSVTYSTNKVGDFEFTNGSDGSSYTTNRIGDYKFTTGSDGYNATTIRIGDTEFTTVTNGGRRYR